jgi:hypothetical protein
MRSMRSSEELVNLRGLSLRLSQPTEPPALFRLGQPAPTTKSTLGRVAAGIDIALVSSRMQSLRR